MILVTLTIAVRVAASMNWEVLTPYHNQYTTLSINTERDIRHSYWNRRLRRRMPVRRLVHVP